MVRVMDTPTVHWQVMNTVTGHSLAVLLTQADADSHVGESHESLIHESAPRSRSGPPPGQPNRNAEPPARADIQTGRHARRQRMTRTISGRHHDWRHNSALQAGPIGSGATSEDDSD